MIRLFLSRQFALFLLTGGTAAVVNFLSRLLYDRWLSFSNAVILAYLTGMVTAFLLAKLFVFPGGNQTLFSSASRFAVVNLLAIAQTWAISMLLAYQLLPALGVERWVPEIAHLIGIAVPVATSYIGHKRWSFR